MMKIKFSWIPILGLFLLLGHNSVFKLAAAAPYEQPTNDTVDIFQVQPDDGAEYSGFALPNTSFPAGHDAFSPPELYEDNYKQSDESAFISDERPVSGIKDDFSSSDVDYRRPPPPPMDDLVIVVEYPIMPPSHQQPSVQQKSEHQQEKKAVNHQQYIRVAAPAYPIYASEQAVRYSPPSQQKVDHQQYVVNAPVVTRPVSVGEQKPVQDVPPSQQMVDQQQYIYKPMVTRPASASEQKVVSFSPPSQQPSVQQRSEPQGVDHQQYKRVPVPVPPTNVSGNAVQYAPPNQRRVDQQKVAPAVARPVDVGEKKPVQDVPPSQQKVDQQHQSIGSEHPSVEIPKPTKSGKKMDQVKLAHIEHFNNEESVKFSFCKRRPDGYYRHPNDCSRILQCFGKELFEYPKCEHGLAFNERKQACDYHFNVEGCTKQTGTPRVKTAAKPIAPTHANRRRVCQGGYVHGEHVADPRDCSSFYRCVWGDLVPMSCGDGTVFNPKLSVCDYPSRVPNASCQMKGIVPSV